MAEARMLVSCGGLWQPGHGTGLPWVVLGVRAGAEGYVGLWETAGDRLCREHIFGDSKKCLTGTLRGLCFFLKYVELGQGTESF